MKLCLILACTNVNAQSWEAPSHNPYYGSFGGSAWFIAKVLEKRMGAEDRSQHSQAVYHALNNAVEGQDVTWYNDREGSHGRARIVYTHPSSGGWCRRVHSLVFFKDVQKTYEDTACYNTHTNSWTWIYK